MKENHKSWDEYLPHIEFAYNRVVHKTTNASPLEVVYEFNPLTPMDLLPLPNPQEFVHKEGVIKADFLKKMHKKIKIQIQKQNEKYTKYNNKGKKEIIFEEGDLVWFCTVLVVGSDDVASSYHVGVLSRAHGWQKGRKSGGSCGRQLLS